MSGAPSAEPLSRPTIAAQARPHGRDVGPDRDTTAGRNSFPLGPGATVGFVSTGAAANAHSRAELIASRARIVAASATQTRCRAPGCSG